MKRLLLKLKFPLLALLILLILIQFIIKDRVHYVSVIFYASPLPAIIILGIVVTIFFYKRKLIFISLLIITASMTIYYFVYYYGKPSEISSSSATSTIIFWNVAQNNPLPTDIIIQELKQSKAEMIALVEAQFVSENDLIILSKACPDFQFKYMYGNMLIGVKGNVEKIKFYDEATVYKLNHIDLRVNQHHYSIALVDVYANPLLNKQIPLSVIYNFTRKNKVDIVMGDFNTPYESVHFENYKEEFISFHSKSEGSASTWPLPFPVIEIDQIWLKKSFQPLKLKKKSFALSDHKMLIATFEVAK